MILPLGINERMYENVDIAPLFVDYIALKMLLSISGDSVTILLRKGEHTSIIPTEEHPWFTYAMAASEGRIPYIWYEYDVEEQATTLIESIYKRDKVMI